MNITKKFLTKSTPFYFQIANKSSSRPKLIVRQQFYKLKQNQKMFQKNDGKPVWLKARRDKLLYQATWLGVYIGLGFSFYELYALSFKKYLFKSSNE